MQRDPAQGGTPDKSAELVGVPLRVDGDTELVGNDVLPAAVPAKLGQAVPVGQSGRRIRELELARRGQRSDDGVIKAAPPGAASRAPRAGLCLGRPARRSPRRPIARLH